MIATKRPENRKSDLRRGRGGKSSLPRRKSVSCNSPKSQGKKKKKGEKRKGVGSLRGTGKGSSDTKYDRKGEKELCHPLGEPTSPE